MLGISNQCCIIYRVHRQPIAGHFCSSWNHSQKNKVQNDRIQNWTERINTVTLFAIFAIAIYTGWWCVWSILNNDGLRQWLPDDILFFFEMGHFSNLWKHEPGYSSTIALLTGCETKESNHPWWYTGNWDHLDPHLCSVNISEQDCSKLW